MTLRDKLREALKVRIKHDVGEGKFDPSNWHNTQFGDFYQNTDPLAQIAVIKTVLRESVKTVLDNAGISMPEQNWRDYFLGITAKSSPTSAITRLLKIIGT